MKKTPYFILSVLSTLTLTGCNGEVPQDEEEYLGPLLGVWEEIVDPSNRHDPKYAGNCEGIDNLFTGTLEFNKDWGYQLDYTLSTFGSYTYGNSNGIFSFESDSVLILDHATDNDNWVLQLLDSLILVDITDTLFVEHTVADPCLRFWKRIE